MKFRSLVAALLLALACNLQLVRSADKLTPDEARSIAGEAYVYGYPLVTMEMSRRVMTNVAEPTGTRAPMGQLRALRTYPDASFRDVTAPNADTLYMAGWIDAGKEPWVLSLPEAEGRYYLFPMLDGWTNVFQSPGTRTTGDGAQKFAITGPKWKGTLPEGIKEYRSPTSLVWFIGRIYCTGTKEDYAAVHRLQDEIKLQPLSTLGKPYSTPAGKVDPSVDMKTPVRDQVNALDAASFFGLLAQLLKDNPPAAEDADVVARLAKLGIVAGEKFDLEKLDSQIRQAVVEAPKAGLKKITDHFRTAGVDLNGWVFTTKTGRYGTDYLQRATIAYFGLGANLPEDAIYPTSEWDIAKQMYSGENKYVVRFAKGKLPPVNAFWSLTMYDDQYFFYANKLNRFTLSARDKLKENADGSIDLYLQHESPGPDKESNWLPAPKGKFVLMLRLYWPRETPPSILDGSWQPPPVEKVDK